MEENNQNKKKKRIWPKVLLGVGGISALFIGGAVYVYNVAHQTIYGVPVSSMDLTYVTLFNSRFEQYEGLDATRKKALSCVDTVNFNNKNNSNEKVLLIGDAIKIDEDGSYKLINIKNKKYQIKVEEYDSSGFIICMSINSMD